MAGFPNPQTLNRYSYVIGNPLKYIDPTGMVIECSSDEEKGGRINCEDDEEVEVVTEAPDEPNLAGFSGFLRFGGLLRSLGNAVPINVLSDLAVGDLPILGEGPSLLGFECDDFLTPALSLGGAGGAVFGGSLDAMATLVKRHPDSRS